MIIRKDPKIRFPNPDPSRVPPGQFVTQQWPVLHFGAFPKVDLGTWKFSIWGEVENPVSLDLGGVPETAPRNAQERRAIAYALDEARQPVGRRAGAGGLEDRPSEARSPLRRRARRRRLDHQRPARRPGSRGEPARDAPFRKTAQRRARRPDAHRDPASLLLEGRQVGQRIRAGARGPRRASGKRTATTCTATLGPRNATADPRRPTLAPRIFLSDAPSSPARSGDRAFRNLAPVPERGAAEHRRVSGGGGARTHGGRSRRIPLLQRRQDFHFGSVWRRKVPARRTAERVFAGCRWKRASCARSPSGRTGTCGSRWSAAKPPRRSAFPFR